MKRPFILIVDDVLANLDLVEAYLSSIDCEAVRASDGIEALALAAAVDLVLLDVGLPGMNGVEVCRRIKASPATALTPVVMITAFDALEDRVRALEAGADDYLTKPVQRTELVARVRSLLRYRAVVDRLDAAEQVVFAFARAVEARDPGTDQHTNRVASNALALAGLMGLDAEAQVEVFQGATLHDIGKIGVPDSVLLKPGPLLGEEMETMRQHSAIGEDIVRPLRSTTGLRAIIRHHHEHFDGGGYPDGLSGEAIPLAARIVAVTDAFDAMTMDRPYRHGLQPHVALATLRQGAGTQWDPRVVDTFLRLLSQRGQPVGDPLAAG